MEVADDQVLSSLREQMHWGKDTAGVLVMSVSPHSSAYSAGLRGTVRSPQGGLILGDIITHVNNTRVKQVEDLLSVVEELKVGEYVSLQLVSRGSEKRRVRVQLVDAEQLNPPRNNVSKL